MKMKPCTDCGIQYDPWIMEFDHKNAFEKKYNVSAMPNLGIRTLQAEVDKCDVVCSNCHKERTFRRRLREDTSLGYTKELMDFITEKKSSKEI